MKSKLAGVLLIFSLLALMFMVAGCVTSSNVRFDANVPGAKVLLDGKDIGTTPTQAIMSNAVWENPEIVLSKEGYKDLRTGVKKTVKPVNLICGLTIWWPSLLWCVGPANDQNFVMLPETK